MWSFLAFFGYVAIHAAENSGSICLKNNKTLGRACAMVRKKMSKLVIIIIIMERMCICTTASLHHRSERPELMKKGRNKVDLYIVLKKIKNY